MKANYDMELLPLHLWRNKETDAYKILYHFFDYTSLEMCRQLLNKWFNAAFEEAYAWKDPPASLLFFYERFEVLLYGCWLLLSNNKVNSVKKKKASRHKASAISQHRAERVEVCKFLNTVEVFKPLTVLHDFFAVMDLYAWRAELHNWYEAGLSKQTILHISNTDNVLPVMERLNKIAEAAYLIYQLHIWEDRKPGKQKALKNG